MADRRRAALPAARPDLMFPVCFRQDAQPSEVRAAQVIQRRPQRVGASAAPVSEWWLEPWGWTALRLTGVAAWWPAWWR
jgi:hypothetical protein